MDSNAQGKMYFYENFASDFDSVVNMYDTQKRVGVVYEELLVEDLTGLTLLDAGCGTGWFSAAAANRGAVVTSMDLGPNLLSEVAKKCESERVIGSILEMPFEDGSFDVVVSSEVIEHVPHPFDAIAELVRVLKPGGILVVTTPNRKWKFALHVANLLNIRPYQGLENWSGFSQLKDELKRLGMEIDVATGIHAFPFIPAFTHRPLDYLHRFNNRIAPIMLNIAIKATKPSKL
jgi:ubiquinone/menaquinone biosynthesis C-methylase UbiE